MNPELPKPLNCGVYIPETEQEPHMVEGTFVD